MNAVDRNVSGSRAGASIAISVSSWRTISAMPFDSAAEARAEQRGEARSATSTPATPPGNVAPTTSASPTMISDWITMLTRPARSRPVISEPRAHRRDEEAVHDAAVDVLDHRHAAPAGREQRRHHHDPGREELDVGVAGKPGISTTLLEQRAEQQQPDDRLHQRDDDPPRLAPAARAGGGRSCTESCAMRARLSSASSFRALGLGASNVRPA